jgi:large subunit ribosomal protein L24
MQDLEFQYGAESTGVKLTGVAKFTLGKTPRFDSVLSGRQIDLDRAFANRGEHTAPATLLGKLAQLAGGGAFRPAIPIQVGIGIDQITLGGDTVQNLRGDISTSAQGWNLDRFEFRAPGFTQARLSGRLEIDGGKATFTGPAEIKANNPQALAAWLEGRPKAANDSVNPLSMRGQLSLAGDKIAIDDLNAEFDGKTVSGRFVYAAAAGNRPARVDVALQAPELDVDAALGFGNALLAGSHIERPHDMTIAVDIGHATIAGLDAHEASARLMVDSGGLQVDRLSIADLGGAAFSASGRIVTAPPSPQGSLRLDLDAPDMTPIVALVSRFAPEAAQTLARGAKAMAPAKLHAALGITGAGQKNQVELTVDGNLGSARLALAGATDLDEITFNPGDVKLQGGLTSDDGKALVAMLGLDRIVSVVPGPGALALDASGPLRGDWKVSGTLRAGGLDANAAGEAHPFAAEPSIDLRVAVLQANAAPLRRAGDEPLPVTFAGPLALNGKELTLKDMDVKVAGAAVRGNLAVTLSAPHRLRGQIEADRADGAGIIAAAIGMPHQTGNKDSAWGWSSEPFGAGAFGDFAGSVALRVKRVALLPEVPAQAFGATLNFGKDAISIDDIAAHMAGGDLKGQVSFQKAPDGLKAHIKLALAGADTAELQPAKPAIKGKLDLASELDGIGLSPIALVGSLRGSGTIKLGRAQMSGLDPHVFDAVVRAVDQGLAIDADHISGVVKKALDKGALTVERAEGDIFVSAGQLRMNAINAKSSKSSKSADARLSVGGNFDLTDGSMDARLVLTGQNEQANIRPELFIALKGPVTAPVRTVDVSGLTGWLTLRSVEQQAKQLRDIERQPPQQAAPPRSEADVRPKAAPVPPAKNSAAAAQNEAISIPRAKPAARATRPPVVRQEAPALPAPIDIHPLPAPATR